MTTPAENAASKGLKVSQDNPDVAEQAVPGHGVPSQDPDAQAQVGLTPQEASREAKSAYVGGGAVAGLATGAAIGALVGGPVGVVVGGTAGVIAGALGGEAAGQAADADPAPKSASTGADHLSAEDDLAGSS